MCSLQVELAVGTHAFTLPIDVASLLRTEWVTCNLTEYIMECLMEELV